MCWPRRPNTLSASASIYLALVDFEIYWELMALPQHIPHAFFVRMIPPVAKRKTMTIFSILPTSWPPLAPIRLQARTVPCLSNWLPLHFCPQRFFPSSSVAMPALSGSTCRHIKTPGLTLYPCFQTPIGGDSVPQGVQEQEWLWKKQEREVKEKDKKSMWLRQSQPPRFLAGSSYLVSQGEVHQASGHLWPNLRRSYRPPRKVWRNNRSKAFWGELKKQNLFIMLWSFI